MNRQKSLLGKLRNWLDDERCGTCECLQGALVQIELDADSETAASASEYRISAKQTHS